MNNLKRYIIRFIIMLLVINYSINTILDLSRLSDFNGFYNILPNEILKRVNVLLAALLVWLAGRNQLAEADNIRMKLVFVVIGFGELFFLLGKPSYAIGSFLICQCLLIYRHSKDLSRKLAKASAAKKLSLFVSALTLLASFVFAFVLLYPILTIDRLVIIGGLYGIILSISLWTAFANYILRLFPVPNSKLIAIGMLCFYFCDIMVALDGLLIHGTALILASSLIWVFYTPAITMLALSSYDFEVRLQIKQQAGTKAQLLK